MHGEKVVSHLVINGFTINPIKDIVSLHILINSLCTIYDHSHECDFGKKIIHENYLGKQIGQPSVSYIENPTFKGLIGFTVLENGYFVIKIWDNIYPAEVQFDLYLDEHLPDCSIILDHLSCPVGIYDGLGLFNATYSLNYLKKSEPPISKDNRNFPKNFNDKTFSTEEYNKDPQNYSLNLNTVEKNECYFCEEKTNNLFFIDYPIKLIFICNFHKNFFYSKTSEIGQNLKTKKIQKIIDDKIVTKNINPTKFDPGKEDGI